MPTRVYKGYGAEAAVFLAARRRLAIRSYPVLPPERGQVRLRLLRSGICGTDVHILAGRLALPGRELILGHEFIGAVEALGSPRLRDGLGLRLRQGDRAIACVARPCGRCFNCRRGETASCLAFGVTYLRDPGEAPHFHGGFAEQLHSPAGNLVRIPRGVDLDAAAAFPCAGPTAIRAFDFAGNLRRGELVVVQGSGPVGLFAAAWAARAGCVVVVIGSGSNPARMKLARRLGARLVLDYRKVDAPARLKAVRALAARLGRGDGADVVFEASGAPTAIPEGLNLVRTLGRYIVPGQYSSSGGVEIQPQLITFKAIRIVGSGQYKLADVGAYLRFLAADRGLQRIFAACITHRHPVGEAAAALAAAAEGRAVKAVLVPR
ncbi:MAG TPA: alcohol dehydrogenase catalytic domain-containing protein [Planctomycetota bacterium]|nr:alcohol dehydrogenase catalytic domain-containing protein [Planctomycetota bacterium]